MVRSTLISDKVSLERYKHFSHLVTRIAADKGVPSGSEQFELRCLQRFECQLQVTEATSACLGTISSSSVISNPFLRKSQARTAVTPPFRGLGRWRLPQTTDTSISKSWYVAICTIKTQWSWIQLFDVFVILQQKEVEFLHNENQLLEGHLQRVSLS